MKPKRSFQFSMGWSSILMIFVILCLTTFGILSFVTADADYRISRKDADTVKSYYQASRSVENRLRLIDGALLQARADARQAAAANSCEGLKNKDLYVKNSPIETILKSSVSEEQKYKACCGAFSGILAAKDGGVSLEEGFGNSLDDSAPMNGTFSVDAGLNRKIEVRLKINPLSDSGRCLIESERLVNPEEAGADSEQHLDLWKGNKQKNP